MTGQTGGVKCLSMTASGYFYLERDVLPEFPVQKLRTHHTDDARLRVDAQRRLIGSREQPMSGQDSVLEDPILILQQSLCLASCQV